MYPKLLIHTLAYCFSSFLSPLAPTPMFQGLTGSSAASSLKLPDFSCQEEISLLNFHEWKT